MTRPGSSILQRSVTALVAMAGAIVCVACDGAGTRRPGDDVPLRVFAAASLQDALREVGERFTDRTGISIEHNFAGSNTLALQIEAVDAADVFISADEAWVDHVVTVGAAREITKRPVAGNRLVIVGRPDGISPFRQLDELARLDRDRLAHFAIADPDAVPAGRYALEALTASTAESAEGMTIEATLRDRIVPTSDVRAALALAESDRGTLAMVYASDAASSSRVDVVHEVDPSLHAPIRYWAVEVGRRVDGVGPDRGAADYLEALGSPESRAIFDRWGFQALDAGAGP